MNSNILKRLIEVFVEDNVERMQLASLAVRKVPATLKGKEKIFENKFVGDIQKLIDDDEDEEVIKNTYKALINLAEYTYGLEILVEFGLLDILVDHLVIERKKPIIILFMILLRILTNSEKANDILLKTNVIKRLNKHLKSDNTKVCLS